ncbi:Chemotaxis protein CheY [uncultured archaeon]|nr:Chemotaxis protein CheY [uncultured archaeon]
MPVEVNVSYISIGKNNYTLTMARDITERKRMENALRESEVRYKTIFETTGTATGVIEEDTKISLVNEEYEKLTGYSREEVEGKKSWMEFVVKEDLERMIKYHNERRIEPMKAPNKYEFRLINRNGNIRDIFLTIAMIPGTKRSIGSLLDITEQRRSEKALKESEERYRLLVESSPDGIIVHNLHELIFVNPAAAKILGSENPEGLIGKPIRQIIHPDYWKIVNERLHMEKEGKPASLIEEKMLKLDGTPIDVEVVAIPYKFDGKLEVHSVVRDISERKRADVVLRESEERFKNIYVQSPIGIEVYDSQGKLIDANKACLDIFGVSDVEEVKGFKLFEDPNITDKIKETLRSGEIVRHEALFDFENVNKYNLYKTTRSGIIYLDLLITPIGEKENAVSGYLVQVQDITVRRRAEEQIREQAALLDKAQDAILVRNLEGSITYWNKSAERLYGWAAEEVISKNANELLYKDIEELSQPIKVQKIVIERGEWSGELHHVTKDGREITVESRWTLMHDNEGKPKSILVINTDITGRKKLEEQFLRAQRMESIGTLAGGIAHDINNVLAPIMLSLELLSEKFTDNESRKLIDILDRSARRGASLIKQVQSFARGVEGERMPLQTAHLISEIRQIANETFPRSIEIRTDIGKDLQTISGDATQLHQVLMNLCVNARDAMPDGGILSISAENIFIDENFADVNIEARVGRYIVIAVTDTGTGIPPKIMGRIFEPFFTTKEHGKGTGLGLSTALGIVKSHGGFINVYSETGKGTTFKVYLPAITATEIQKVEEPREHATGHGELILAVDDEKQVRDITISVLEKHGYSVLTACNGMEAIALYKQNREEIKLVLMDMMMPVMDGLAGIQELRKINPELKIIAASGLTEKDKLTKAAGMMNAFLTKPYTTGKLLRTIHEVLSAE